MDSMKVTSIKTIKGRKPMQESFDYTLCDDDNRKESCLINIRPNVEYQEIKGFGGAFTEAAAVTLNKLSKENQTRILKLYFDPVEGIGYNLGRVHINSCDFSLGKPQFL